MTPTKVQDKRGLVSRDPAAVIEEAMRANPRLLNEGRKIASFFANNEEHSDPRYPMAIGLHYLAKENARDYEFAWFFFYLDSYLGQSVNPLRVEEEGTLVLSNEAVSVIDAWDVIDSESLGILAIPRNEEYGYNYHVGAIMGSGVDESGLDVSRITLIFRNDAIRGVLEKCLANITLFENERPDQIGE